MPADLGALGGAGDGGFALASLDGEDEGSSSNSFDLPAQDAAPLPASIGPAPASKKPPERPKSKPSAALDLFAPPSEGEDLPVDFATEDVAERAHKAAHAPTPEPPSASSGKLPVTQSQPLTRRTPASMPAAEPVTSLGPREVSRASFVLVVLVALAVGFIPVHFIANMREKSAFAKIDLQVASAHSSADSMETYLALDGFREKLLDEKASKRQMIALTSMLLWAVLSTGIGFALLRRMSPPRKTPAASSS
jgi:hypothetical protein